MLIPLSWLKKYLDLPQSPAEIARVLDLAGLEVDALHQSGASFAEVVVAEVKECLPHPDAEKLRIATVFDGKESFQVVCGAPNCRAGIKTAFAKIGAKLGDTKIKKGKLRGVESCGMLCSADELSLPGEHDGIMELNLPLGTDLASLYNDTVLEISLTPNLGHCASVYGIARELAALLEIPLKTPSADVQEKGPKNTLPVQIEDPRCLHYACRVIDHVKVGPSPEWLSSALDKAGIRSINNVVDITNYVMLEMGQPLHAFDASGIDALFIGKGTGTLVTLDNTSRSLPDQALLIKSTSDILAIAGVMGGLNSAVSDNTTSLILESAHFDPIAIRLTSKALTLRTESSARFEKGIDPLGVIKALNRAAALIAELTGGTIRQGIQEVNNTPFHPLHIPLKPDKINALLGTQFSQGEIEAFLHRLDFTLVKEHAIPPSYRNDIREEVDLAEEVARLFGYNNIPRPTAKSIPSTLPHAPLFIIEQKVRRALIGEGLQEFLTCDLISPALASIPCEKTLSSDNLVHVKNPASFEQSVLRSSLLPGLLQSTLHNFAQRTFDLSCFEVGRIHFKIDDDVKERSTVGILLTGASTPHHYHPKTRPVDFFDLKGIIENLLLAFHITPTFEPSSFTTFHPGIQASILHGDLKIGSLGRVHPDHIEIEQPLFYAELDLHDLSLERHLMTPLPQFPGSERDITLTVDRKTPAAHLIRALKKTPSSLLKSVEIIDLYEGKNSPPDQRNITLRLTYRHDHKTLSSEAVEKEHARLLLALNPQAR